MGRAKRTVPKGKFRLRTTGKSQPNKLYQINIEYSWNGTVIRKATDVKARIADWNPKGNMGRGELRPSYGEEYKRTNALLTQRLDRIDADLVEYNAKHPNKITVDVVRDIIENKPIMRADEGIDFVEFALEKLKGKYTSRKIGASTYDDGRSYLRKFGEFLISRGLGTHKPNGIYVGEITPEILQSYIDWRRTVLRNRDETINHSLTPILDACNYGCDLGYIRREINAYLQEMRIKIRLSIDEDSQDNDVRFLTKEQLEQLLSFYDECSDPRRKEYIEMFLFAFHACGMRVSDIMTLQWSRIDLKKRQLTKIFVKNKKRNTIPLTSPAITILQKWKRMDVRKRFVFDLAEDTLNLKDDNAIYKARTNATKCINQSLKIVGEQLELPFELTMHVARHTYAVLALNDGIDMSVISRLLGHASTDTTEKIYAIYMPTTLDEAVDKLNYNFLPKGFGQ